MASDVGESTNWESHSDPQTDERSNENSDSRNQQSGEPTSSKPQNPSDSGEGSGFECNICLDLARDPVVTLCGHLFCWPCLYRWLRHHSHSQDCPVCKALVQEEKLVPLYGRGKTQSDPRSRPIDIPNRPAGQRPETAQLYNHPNAAGFGPLGGIIPMATASFGGISISAGFSNLFPAVHVHVQGTPPTAAAYGAAPGFAYGGHDGGGAREVPEAVGSQGLGTDNDNSSALSKIFLLFGAAVVLFLSWGYE